MGNAELSERDLKVLWHPCTQMHDHESMPLVPIKHARGVWLEDYEGKRYLDAISSWWVNLFGHNHPEIMGAIKVQAESLDHVLLAGFTHEPAIALAEALVRAAPPGLTKAFYADNGSSAVEVALKMSFHYWRNLGETGRQAFVALEGSYHGETLGALSVGNLDLYRKAYAPLLLRPYVAPSPDSRSIERGERESDYLARRLAEVERIFQAHGREICALIVEPLVQCAGGMRMHAPGYLAGLRQLCDRYRIHLIADEIAVGFGRTGTLFACEQAGISPDLMCLSKGLTGGSLPLAAVLATEEIYQAFYGEYRLQKAFLHSHSYTGNPIACAAALATLGLFAKEPVLAQNRVLAERLAAALAPLRDHPRVANLRQTGLIAAFDLVQDKGAGIEFPAERRKGLAVHRHALRQGVLIRPLGNVVYFMPPYAIVEDEIRFMVDAARAAVDHAVKDDQ